jgi:hypothetical protein
MVRRPTSNGVPNLGIPMTYPICPFPREGECLTGGGYPTEAVPCVRVARFLF